MTEALAIRLVRRRPTAAVGRTAGEADKWRAIDGVTGLDQPFTLDLIVKDDLVDACIDNRRTLITCNRTKATGDRLLFFVSQGEIHLDEVRLRPLVEAE